MRIAVGGHAMRQHWRGSAGAVRGQGRRVVEPERLHHRGRGILRAAWPEYLGKGSSEGRRLEVGIVIQQDQIVLYLIDLVPVLPWILVMFREVFCEVEICGHQKVV